MGQHLIPERLIPALSRFDADRVPLADFSVSAENRHCTSDNSPVEVLQMHCKWRVYPTNGYRFTHIYTILPGLIWSTIDQPLEFKPYKQTLILDIFRQSILLMIIFRSFDFIFLLFILILTRSHHILSLKSPDVRPDAMKDGVFEVCGFGETSVKCRWNVGETAAGSGAGMAVEQGCSCICAAEVLHWVILGQQKSLTHRFHVCYIW